AGLKRGLAKGRREGRKEGLAEGMARNVITLMKKTNQTVSEVMEMLDIDKEIQPEINQFIKTQINNNRI
ncbi:hypothetical protein D5266_09315, partial [bacterium c-19]|nr:hypothetical protein [bacterium c-19]